MESKYAPGPWFQSHCKNDDGTYSTKVYDHKHVIATLSWYPVDLGNGVTGTLREGNAKLIAAAPELLEALKNILDLAMDGYNHNSSNAVSEDVLQENRTLLMKAREAIKKATE